MEYKIDTKFEIGEHVYHVTGKTQEGAPEEGVVTFFVYYGKRQVAYGVSFGPARVCTCEEMELSTENPNL